MYRMYSVSLVLLRESGNGPKWNMLLQYDAHGLNMTLPLLRRSSHNVLLYNYSARIDQQIKLAQVGEA